MKISRHTQQNHGPDTHTDHKKHNLLINSVDRTQTNANKFKRKKTAKLHIT